MSVKVAVRSRPLNENEGNDESDVVIRMNDQKVTVVDNLAGTGHTFLYDEALWSSGVRLPDSANPEASQQTVYDHIGAELLSHVITGYNGCIFAYGQTGSGKTYCMMGTEAQPGLVPRIAQTLFAECARLRQAGVETLVEISYYEIYNEKVRCLLRPTQGGFDDTTLRVREHPKFGPFIEGLAKFVVTSQSECLQLMNDGNKVRTTASTAMNATSSRSHAVFAVTLTQKRKRGTVVSTTTSRLNLVDLAGSERASKTMATGKRLAEGANINKSLSSLGNVISALAEVEETGKPRHIPYRDSTLTWILKDNLGGNSKTVMLATVSPSFIQYEETMSTLRYAERAKKIVNKAVINESNNNEVIASLQKEIEALKAQLQGASEAERARLQEELAASEAVKKDLDSSLEEKLADTRRMMQEREQYMRQLEERLHAQTNQIEALKNENEEKERRISDLLKQIESLSAASVGSPTKQEAVEKMREKVASLENEQNVSESNMKGHRSVSTFPASGETVDEVRVADLADAASPVTALPATDFAPEPTVTTAPADDLIAADDITLDSADDFDNLDLALQEDLTLSDTDATPDVAYQDPNGSSDHDEELPYDEDIDFDDSIVLDDLDGSESSPSTVSSKPTSAAAPQVGGCAPPLEQPRPQHDLPAATIAGAAGVAQPSPVATSSAGSSSATAKSIVTTSVADRRRTSLHGVAIHAAITDSADVHHDLAQTDARPEIFAPTQNVTTLVVPSHSLPNNRYLQEPFKVVKMKETSHSTNRKDRIWLVDFLARKFGNYDMHGKKSFEQPASNLFRVESDATHSRRLTLHFFDAPHPYELEFTSTGRRRKFYELACLLRRNSISWCPSLCPSDENDALIDVHGTTIDRPNAPQTVVSGESRFMVARMPYEVIDLWCGCFSLGDADLPQSGAVLSGFIPKAAHEVYVIGVMDVPSSLIGNEELGSYFLAYIGSASYYVLGTTTSASKKHGTNNAIIIICRRSFIVRLSHVEMTELTSSSKAGKSKECVSGACASIHINEASFGFVLVNVDPRHSLSDQSRTASIRSLMASFPFGDCSIDVSSRFDYLVVAGHFGFSGSFSGNDLLRRHMNTHNLLSNMNEGNPSPPLRQLPDPCRILYAAKAQVCRIDINQYSTSRAVPFSNAFVTADVFCQRPYLSLFGEQVPCVQILMDQLVVSGPRLPGFTNGTIRVHSSFIEGSPVAARVRHSGENEWSVAGLDVPVLHPCVNNGEFQRLQSITFSIVGTIEGGTKPSVVASGSLSLKHALRLAESASFQIPLLFHTCVVGTLRGFLLPIYDDRNDAEVHAAGFRHERFVYVYSYFENEVRDVNGSWMAPTSHICHFSTRTPTQPRSREDCVLPNTTQWRWLNDWQHETRQDDLEGWAYAARDDGSFEPSESPSSKFRRRHWSRALQAEDPLSYHQFLASHLRCTPADE